MTGKNHLSLDSSPLYGVNERNERLITNSWKTLLNTCALILILAVWGCSDRKLDGNSINWKMYENNRYGFKFPYPSNWQSQSLPTNDDGAIFVLPGDESVEIRSWASQGKLDLDLDAKAQGEIFPNFQTQQGKKGVLVVEATPQATVMKLMLKSDRINYYWQGKSPKDEFNKYYRFFYYIARNYQVIEVKGR